MAEDCSAGPLFGAVLFTPGDRPDRLEKGWSASRGALIIDLEDGVAPDRKGSARETVAEWIAGGHQALVRINAVDSMEFRQDAAKLGNAGLRGVVIPKAQSAADIAAVRAVWPNASLYPIIESPSGLTNLGGIAASDGVRQLLFGALDLHAACGIRFPEPSFIAYCRIKLVLASKVAGLAAPVDTPCPGYRDLEVVTEDASAAVRLGCNAKLCIHPAQIGPVNAAFRPSEDEMAWAREVIEAGRSGGAVTVRGAMVDAPVISSAEQILERGLRLEGA